MLFICNSPKRAGCLGHSDSETIDTSGFGKDVEAEWYQSS